MKVRVSFDFDNTLSRIDVQDFCKELIYYGLDVWIVTSRSRNYCNNKSNDNDNSNDNKDLFFIAENLEIKKENIIFTNGFTEGFAKSDFFKINSDFLFHLDDDSVELDFINRETKVKGISCLGKNNCWKRECYLIINSNLM
jgi:hypothetical protein